MATALGLLVAALIYPVFAVLGDAGMSWIGVEIAGVLLYGTCAWLGYTRTAWWLIMGWAAHMIWDVALHHNGPGAAFTPGWYPALCVGFDSVVAIVLAYLILQGKRSAIARDDTAA